MINIILNPRTMYKLLCLIKLLKLKKKNEKNTIIIIYLRIIIENIFTKYDIRYIM